MDRKPERGHHPSVVTNASAAAPLGADRAAMGREAEKNTTTKEIKERPLLPDADVRIGMAQSIGRRRFKAKLSLYDDPVNDTFRRETGLTLPLIHLRRSCLLAGNNHN